jgi:hypothetical protein
LGGKAAANVAGNSGDGDTADGWGIWHNPLVLGSYDAAIVGAGV